jgi:hypothetical protein
VWSRAYELRRQPPNKALQLTGLRVPLSRRGSLEHPASSAPAGGSAGRQLSAWSVRRQ